MAPRHQVPSSFFSLALDVELETQSVDPGLYLISKAPHRMRRKADELQACRERFFRWLMIRLGVGKSRGDFERGLEKEVNFSCGFAPRGVRRGCPCGYRPKNNVFGHWLRSSEWSHLHTLRLVAEVMTVPPQS